ncbi:hypothetical protein SFRURICE_014231 [Spodoptera frugiperda]|uniref:SFRICE_015901 n=1 Tax=Spodoptera frugiperda TaxID=7108 RepID=A0A2H1WQW6_SPOFR|nr:hypothetical protein SFRURICE_014231 [Spodoptera frugiperda]
MENLRAVLSSVDIMNETDAALNTFDTIIKSTEARAETRTNNIPSGTEASARPLQCADCNDGERAIIHSFMSLMQHCIELAERVGTEKA